MKRVLFLVLAGLVCTGLFAGGQQGSTSSDGLTTIKVWGNNRQLPLTGATLALGDWTTGTLPSKLWDKFVEEVAKRGVRLDMTLVMPDQIVVAFQTLVASGQFSNFDWVSPINFTDAKARYNLVNQRLLLPLDTAIQQYSDGTARNYFASTPAGQRMKKMNTLEDGHMYWLSQTDAFYYKEPNNIRGEAQGGLIRLDWLRQLNLPTPTTLDEFFDTLKAFQDRDVNMNALKDEIALINIANEQFARAFSGYFGIGAGNVAYIVGDRVYSGWYSDRVRDYITYLQRLYRAGLLKITTDGSENPSNKVAFFGTYFSDTWTDPQVIVPAGRPKAYFAPLVIQAHPATPAMVYEQPGLTQYLQSGMYVIPAASKNVEKMVKLIDYFHTPEYTNLGEWGIEGYSYNVNPDGTRTRIQINSSNVGLDQNLTVTGDALPFAAWQTPFPRMRRGDRQDLFQAMIDAGRSQGYSEGFTVKNDQIRNFYENKWPTFTAESNIGGITSFPTVAEADRVAALRTDLNTYSAELMTALIMGEKSLDNWNTYMADFRRLGLDEMLAIYQAQLNRMK